MSELLAPVARPEGVANVANGVPVDMGGEGTEPCAALPPRDGAIGHAPSPPDVRAEWERTLANSQNYVSTALSVFSRRAEAAQKQARSRDGAPWATLDADLKAVRSQASALMGQQTPDALAAAVLWKTAELRWKRIASAPLGELQGMAAQAEMQRATSNSVGLVKTVHVSQIISRLAGRGMVLSVTHEGQIAVMPRGLLNDTDRAQISQHKAELVEALSTCEVVT